MRALIRVVSHSLLPLLFAATPLSLNAQESSRQNGESTTAMVPPRALSGLLDSMREQLNPYQPQKLQSLLIKPEVQAALEIDRSTYRMISGELADVMKRSAEVFKDFDPSKVANREEIQARLEKHKELQAERERITDLTLNEIFPPKKFNRLKQIALQIQIQEAGLGNVLIYGVLAEEMQFSESQFEAMSQKAVEYEQEKQAKIRLLNEEYDAKLLKSLTPKQRKLFEQQVGEDFEYAPASREAQSFERLREFKQRQLTGNSPIPER